MSSLYLQNTSTSMVLKIVLLNVNSIAIVSIKHKDFFFWKVNMFCACVIFWSYGYFQEVGVKKEKNTVLKARAGEKGELKERELWSLLENPVYLLYFNIQQRVFQYLISVTLFPKTKSFNSTVNIFPSNNILGVNTFPISIC